MRFKDYFSNKASQYTKYRPRYPAALFEYVAGLTNGHERAWDCATGSGQAALGLTTYFGHIIATDASKKQIANAIPHTKISYAVARAEKTEIKSNSIDLTVVAQAVHWFDIDEFYSEVSRVAKLGGVIAVWCYSLLRISSAMDRLLDYLYTDVVGPFWPPERKLVDDKYQSIPFPFQELRAPMFEMEAEWRLEHLLGYLGTWSSVQRYMDMHNANPLKGFEKDLRQLWGQPEDKRRVHWPIHLRVGRMQ